MVKDFCFKDIRTYLEKKKDNNILDSFDKLADAAIIFAPIVLGPQFLPLLGLLDVKDRLFDLGRNILGFIVSEEEPDYILRAEKIKVAYAFISFTAYFDALSKEFPHDIRKKLISELENKQELVKIDDEQYKNKLNIHCEVPYVDHVTSFSETIDLLERNYANISKNIMKLINDTKLLENEKKKQEQLENVLTKLPKKAVEIYKAQYINLADTFSDFAFFAQCEEFKALHKANYQHAESLNILAGITANIDVGLQNLCRIVNTIATNYNKIQSQDIVFDLKKVYQSHIEQPIIDDKEITSNEELISLSFPKIVNAFIPQSYKCLLYKEKKTLLEKEYVWNEVPIYKDLNKFFVRYLYSPDSIEFPLVILGHPGSGKSLLTKILSAQLMCDSYTVIRIPLREVDAEADIGILVEEQIKKITNRPLQGGYGEFAKQFSEKPLIIILDGYDELLQAKGEVFSGYLEKIRTFQQNQKGLARPVRVIVTSRITLIDKAHVPINSTILRLMEFDEEQRNAWIKIWNETNTAYFSSKSPKIKSFSLSKGERNSLIELAEQPLLLLMLALYDSEDNSLAKINSTIKKTELYDNLLRRFIRRERRRYFKGFDNLLPQEQENIIDIEMKRLGVVAIGMYNRRKLVINSKELDSDLNFFESSHEPNPSKNQQLKDSESLLGGFFFIHQSTAKDTAANSEHIDSAFEFLHNTFGEFLTADFILRNSIQEVKTIYNYRTDEDFSVELKRKLSTLDGLGKEWFACLMFTPLYSRPVVIKMIQEHVTKFIQQRKIPHDKFIENLCFIVKRQLYLILSTKQFPEVMLKDIDIARDIPLLGYLSIYTMNLIILVSALCQEGFEFNEDDYKNTETVSFETKPWDKLSFLWRTWFSSEDLTGLAAILKASRETKNKIRIYCNDKFEAASYIKPIDILLCISSTLADNLLVALSGIHTQNFQNISKMEQNEFLSFLERENLELYISFLISLLRKEINDINIEHNNVNNLIIQIIRIKISLDINRDIILALFEIVECCNNRNLLFIDIRNNLLKFISATIDLWMRKKEKPDQVCIYGIHLLQSLSINKNIYIFDSDMIFDKTYFRINLFENEFDTNIEYLFRYQPRYMRINIRDFYGKNYLFYEQKNLLSVIEDISMYNSDEKSYILDTLLNCKNIDILLKTNPKLISEALLILIKDNTIKSKYKNELIVDFLRRCPEHIRSIGITNFGYDALLNILKIAKYNNISNYLQKISEELFHQLKEMNSKYFVALFFSYPSLIIELINLMPDSFIKEKGAEIYEWILYKDSMHYFVPKKYLEYLNVFRHLIENVNISSHNYFDDKMIYKFQRMFLKNVNIDVLNLEKMTIEELNILKWFAEKTNDKNINKVIDNIKSKLLSDL
jgi:hypothetical protein